MAMEPGVKATDVQTIDGEIRLTPAEAAEQTRNTLLAQRWRLDALAQMLLEKEAVDRAGLDTLMNMTEPRQSKRAQAAQRKAAAS